MATILHIMGPTCAGKSTIIDQLQLLSDKVYTVQIGRMLRLKYGEAYFKGHGSPEHTREEALKMYFELIEEGISHDKKLILVDGQPRDVGQAKEMTKHWVGHHDAAYLLVTASHEERERRAKAGRKPGPDLDLAISRLTNDYQSVYSVLVELIAQGVDIKIADTSAPGHNTVEFCTKLLDEYI